MDDYYIRLEGVEKIWLIEEDMCIIVIRSVLLYEEFIVCKSKPILAHPG